MLPRSNSISLFVRIILMPIVDSCWPVLLLLLRSVCFPWKFAFAAVCCCFWNGKQLQTGCVCAEGRRKRDERLIIFIEFQLRLRAKWRRSCESVRGRGKGRRKKNRTDVPWLPDWLRWKLAEFDARGNQCTKKWGGKKLWNINVAGAEAFYCGNIATVFKRGKKNKNLEANRR